MPTYCLLTLFFFPRHSFNMGVQGAFAYLLEHGFEGEQVGPAQEGAHIHVDVLSMYFAYIVATMTLLLFRAFCEQSYRTLRAYRQ